MSKVKVDTRLIFKDVGLMGHSFMFPAGTMVFVQKAVTDENGAGAYHGLVFGNRHVTEVQFDVNTLELKGFDARAGGGISLIPFESVV